MDVAHPFRLLTYLPICISHKVISSVQEYIAARRICVLAFCQLVNMHASARLQSAGRAAVNPALAGAE